MSYLGVAYHYLDSSFPLRMQRNVYPCAIIRLFETSSLGGKRKGIKEILITGMVWFVAKHEILKINGNTTPIVKNV